jgi:hypothetical protein
MKTHLLKVILALAITSALSTLAASTAKSAGTAATVATVTTAATAGQNKTAPEEKPVPKSTFGIPAKPQDGQDPFFPASDRLYAVKSAPVKQAPSTPGPALMCNGIAGTQDRRLAMINSKTVAEGEDVMVTTSAGRVRVHCLEIKANAVIIEVAGERRELLFQDR